MEQKNLVEQNHSLIYSFMRRNHLTENAVEDWYGLCAEALCYAAVAYNEKKGVKFNTLAFVCMYNIMKKQLCKNDKGIDCCSMNNKVVENEEYIDCLCSFRDELGEAEFYDIYKNNYYKLDDRAKKIIDMCITTEQSTRDIGKAFGVSKQRVSQIYRGFLESVYTDLHGGDVK